MLLLSLVNPVTDWGEAGDVHLIPSPSDLAVVSLHNPLSCAVLESRGYEMGGNDSKIDAGFEI